MDLAQALAGQQLSSAFVSSSSSSFTNEGKKFPVIGGKVEFVLPEFGVKMVVEVFDNLFIKDVMINEQGKKIPMALGQRQSYLAKGIFRWVPKESVMEESRYETCVFLNIIQEAIAKNGKVNMLVNTNFGLKYLEWAEERTPSLREDRASRYQSSTFQCEVVDL